MPRTVDVELREDLVDCCAAGEVVTVVGLVRVLDTAADPGANLLDGPGKSRLLQALESDDVTETQHIPVCMLKMDGGHMALGHMAQVQASCGLPTYTLCAARRRQGKKREGAVPAVPGRRVCGGQPEAGQASRRQQRGG